MDDFIRDIPQDINEYIEFYNNLPEEEKCNYNTPELVQETNKISTLQNKYYELQKKLSDTDYVVIKISEGAATREEYSEIINSRQIWRDEINALLTEMNANI